MAQYILHLPDVGEGTVEAELVEWLVTEDEEVREDQALASVMTDKATVEIPSPVSGRVIKLAGEIGAMVAVGAPLIYLDVEGAGAEASPQEETPPEATAASDEDTQEHTLAPPASQASSPRVQPTSTPMASHAVRARAAQLGLDLRAITGSGPNGRVMNDDLDAAMRTRVQPPETLGVDLGPFETVKVIGLRRRIAENMSHAASSIPHITYVEEVDVTAVEALRAKLNEDAAPKLSLLPFLMRAIARAVPQFPQINAHCLDAAGEVRRYRDVHVGVATQTDQGLMVPVARNVEQLSLQDCAREVKRLADAARGGSARREELSGSTITITSLGALGGICTTPIINAPEVAIVGVNKMRVVPVWDGAAFAPRKMMNLSSSFDHRVVDGWDAASFIQAVKALLEAPETI